MNPNFSSMGKKVASNSLWYEPVSVNVSSHFKQGTNILAVKATNNGGPGALIVQLEIISAEGKETIPCNRSFLEIFGTGTRRA
jgi:hypothetical protein